MLGHDMRELLDDTGRNCVLGLLLTQVDPDKQGVLPHEMNTGDPERAQAWLSALLRGLQVAD